MLQYSALLVKMRAIWCRVLTFLLYL